MIPPRILIIATHGRNPDMKLKALFVFATMAIVAAQHRAQAMLLLAKL
jgi:hypothetical protein